MDQFAILWYVAVVITRLNEIKAKIKTLNKNLETPQEYLCITEICKVLKTLNYANNMDLHVSTGGLHHGISWFCTIFSKTSNIHANIRQLLPIRKEAQGTKTTNPLRIPTVHAWRSLKEKTSSNLFFLELGESSTYDFNGTNASAQEIVAEVIVNFKKLLQNCIMDFQTSKLKDLGLENLKIFNEPCITDQYNCMSAMVTAMGMNYEFKYINNLLDEEKLILDAIAYDDVASTEKDSQKIEDIKGLEDNDDMVNEVLKDQMVNLR